MWEFYKMWNTLGKIGIIVGFLGGIIGVVVAVVATYITSGPILAIPILIVCIIFFAIFFFAFKHAFGPAIQKRKLLKTGVPAEATILQVRETGVTMQGGLYFLVKFLLEVRPQGKPAYQVETKSMVSRLTIAQFQPGATVQVMVDPNDPQKVAMLEQTEAQGGTGAMGTGAFSGGGGASAANTAQLQQMLLQLDAKNRQIMAIGTSAKAKILAAAPMGITVNGPNPAMTFSVEVQPEGESSFTAECKGVIAAASVSKYQPGKMIYVKYNPGNKSEVTIERSA